MKDIESMLSSMALVNIWSFLCTQVENKVKPFKDFSYGEIFHCTTLCVALSVPHENESKWVWMVLTQPIVDDLKSLFLKVTRIEMPVVETPSIMSITEYAYLFSMCVWQA